MSRYELGRRRRVGEKLAYSRDIYSFYLVFYSEKLSENFPKYLQKLEKEDEDYGVNLWIKKYFLVSRRRRGDHEETKIFWDTILPSHEKDKRWEC